MTLMVKEKMESLREQKNTKYIYKNVFTFMLIKMQTQRATSSRIPTTTTTKKEVKSHICNIYENIAVAIFFMCIKRSLHLYGPLMAFMEKKEKKKGEIDLGPIGDEALMMAANYSTKQEIRKLTMRFTGNVQVHFCQYFFFFHPIYIFLFRPFFSARP